VREPEIEVIVTPANEDLRPVLQLRGHVHSYDNIGMTLDELSQAVERRVAAPEGLTWQAVDEHTVRAAHACFSTAFRDVDGAHMLPVDEFARFMFTAQVRPRVLLDGDRGCVELERAARSNVFRLNAALHDESLVRLTVLARR
jgi:hypothetical protein